MSLTIQLAGASTLKGDTHGFDKFIKQAEFNEHSNNQTFSEETRNVIKKSVQAISTIAGLDTYVQSGKSHRQMSREATWNARLEDSSNGVRLEVLIGTIL